MSKSPKNKKNKKNFHILLRLFLELIVLLSVAYFVLSSLILSEKEAKNILIVSDNLDERSNYVSLAHLSKNNENNIIIFFDGSEVISINDDYGDYSLNTVYQLLKIDKKTDQKIKSVFSNVFNIVIDDVVVINESGDDSESKNLRKIFARNLTQKKIIKLYLLANSMDIIEVNELSDVKNYYHKLFTIDKEISQNCSVSVVNTTPKTALARSVTEIIENTGAQVVQVESNDSNIEKTIVYYPENRPECGQIIDKFLGVFSVEPIIKFNAEMPSTQQFRSSIVIMIGKDY